MNSIIQDSGLSSEQTLCERFGKCFSTAVNSDEHLAWRGRYVTADITVQIGSVPFLVRIQEGRIKECRRGLPLLCSTVFAVKGTTEAWAAFWENPPKPKWHDIFALTKFGHMSVEGNLQPFMANLQYFKDVLAVPRKGEMK
jgi:hypothetical protein